MLACRVACQPLALHVLLGLAVVAWPVGLEWAVEMRLRRQHTVAMCRECEGEREGTGRHRVQQQNLPRTPSCAQPGEDKEAAGASACKVPDGSVPAPTEAPAVCPHRGTPAAAAGAPRCSAHYHSRMASATISIKVCCKPCNGFRSVWYYGDVDPSSQETELVRAIRDDTRFAPLCGYG